jgi:hypothetical protein
MKQPPTKEEQIFMNKVAELGCIVSITIEDDYGMLEKVRCEQPPELHHPRYDVGASQRSSHYNVIPLCERHHRTGGKGVAIHSGKKTWEAKFGTEEELIEKRNQLLGVDYE